MNLPDTAAKRTKKNRAIFARWNAAVRKLLEEHGAALVAEHKEDPEDPIIGYDYLRFELETPAGKLTVSPAGNWLACRFDDPDRAATFLRAWGAGALYNLNTYSGKWNFHYFGADFQYALDAVRDLLDRVTGQRKAS